MLVDELRTRTKAASEEKARSAVAIVRGIILPRLGERCMLAASAGDSEVSFDVMLTEGWKQSDIPLLRSALCGIKSETGLTRLDLHISNYLNEELPLELLAIQSVSRVTVTASW